MTILGVDYGRGKVGLAVATTPLAEPLVSVDREVALGAISQIITERKVKLVVVGLPHGSLDAEIKTFADEIHQQNQVEVELVDETLSSYSAQEGLHHAKKSTKRGPDHHFAAAVILQHYLDTIS